MPKISAERMFKSHYPKASIDSVHPGYVIILDREWVGVGPTEAQAWAEACKRKGIVALKETP